VKRFLVNLFYGTPNISSTPLYDPPRRRIFKGEREIHLAKGVRSCGTIDNKGDYLEYGLYPGTSLISALKHAQEQRLRDMRFLQTTRSRDCPTMKENSSALATSRSPKYCFVV
jgi:hypothetical protein